MTGRPFRRVIDDCVEIAVTLPQVFPLEKWFSYNNSGFVLLGRVIEVVNGSYHDAAMAELVFDPLGAHDTLLDGSAVLGRRYADGHYAGQINGVSAVAVQTPMWLPRSINPAGGIWSTTRDVRKALVLARRYETSDRAFSSPVIPRHTGRPKCLRGVGRPREIMPSAAGSVCGFDLDALHGRLTVGHRHRDGEDAFFVGGFDVVDGGSGRQRNGPREGSIAEFGPAVGFDSLAAHGLDGEHPVVNCDVDVLRGIDAGNLSAHLVAAVVRLILEPDEVAVEERTQAREQGSATQELGEIGHQGAGLTLDRQS
jgi:hypothetical protein